MRFQAFRLLVPALAVAIQLPAPAAAQLAPRADMLQLPEGAVPLVLQRRRGKAAASTAAPQMSLGVANEIQMLRTMAGVKALRPAFAKCDASELALGQPGETFVAGDIRIINTGTGQCPEIGTSVKGHTSMLDRMR
jgi:hypothetical protein